MNEQHKFTYKPNDTTKFFNKINTILYILGLPKFWIENVKLSKRFVKIYDIVSAVIHVMTVIFAILQFGSLFTQKNLTAKQMSDAMVIGISNPLGGLFVLVYYYYRDETRLVFYYLAVVFKEVHNDEIIERSFIKKLRVYMIAYTCSASAILIYYGINGLMQVHAGGPFITVITAWPDITENSKVAAVARVGFYLFWCIHIFRVSVGFLVLLIMLIGLSHQYRNLQSYFESLNGIFDKVDVIHAEKENKYLKALAKGIKSHSDTIWCTRQCQLISEHVFTSHILMATGALIVLMAAMVNSKLDFEEMCSYVTNLIIALIIMGFFMWNGGDITFEASKVPDDIYGSGWHNCHNKASVRVRSLVVIAMSQAQQPIVLTALTIVDLSYDTYIAIIKSAYSVFSVFY